MQARLAAMPGYDLSASGSERVAAWRRRRLCTFLGLLGVLASLAPMACGDDDDSGDGGESGSRER